MAKESKTGQSRVALVTGGAIRLGRAIALELAGHGVNIALHYRSSADQAERTAREIAACGVECQTFCADLAKTGELPGLIDAVIAHFGRLNFLVNNAAIFYPTPLGEVSEEQWDELFGINLKSPFFLTQAAAPALEASRGAVVFMADVGGLRPWARYAPYCATKSGIVSLTWSLAQVMAPAVRVNAVAPGPVLLPENYSEDDRRRSAQTTLLERIGSPEAIARAARYLLLEADYTTGQVLRVDGGRYWKNREEP